MALMNCPECGKEISASACTCPNCGFSIPKMKFCKFCAEQVPVESVVCPKCGKQIEELGKADNIVINNSSSSSASAAASASATAIQPNEKKAKNKGTAILLCLTLGAFGAHKFYEGKIGMGILYICTGGLFLVGVFVDLFSLLSKPNPYYV